MKTNYYITGDCHGCFTKFANIKLEQDEKGIVICLGDFSINYYLNKTDTRAKKELSQNYPNLTFYCLRGNHEQRPQLIDNMLLAYDKNVWGEVYYEEAYPNIKYFKDYGFYKIQGYLCLVIGGAYSIDKYWRLARAGLTEETNIPKKTGWFENEQLTKAEMNDCLDDIDFWNRQGIDVDFILTHTCPKSFQPIDMFLKTVDQSTVDDTMEKFLDKVNYSISWKYWLFGHYHDNRLERPHVELYYNDIEEIDNIVARWDRYDKTGELDWWLKKSPNFDKEI